MTHRIWHSRHAAGTIFAVAAFALVPAGVAIAQQTAPVVPSVPPAVTASPAPAAATAQNSTQAATPAGPAPRTQIAPAAAAAAPTQPVAPAAQTAGPVAAPPAVKSASPEEANPFSNVKTTDDSSVKQELPVLEHRLESMEKKMNAIEQVQAVLPADALNSPGSGSHAHGPAADQESMELETATFVACVNGRALFRDTDQKPFFVDAKEANQNEAVHRIGGCKP